MARRIPRKPGKATPQPGKIPRSTHGSLGRGGNFDTVYGGGQFDTAYGGGQFDTVYGGGQFDTVYGGGVGGSHAPTGPVTVKVIHPTTRKALTIAYNPRTKLYLDEKTKSWKPAPQWMRTQIR